MPDGQSNTGDFIIDEDRKATEQDVVNITDTEYQGFWITVNEVNKEWMNFNQWSDVRKCACYQIIHIYTRNISHIGINCTILILK